MGVFEALQRQAEAMPAAAQHLQTLIEQMERAGLVTPMGSNGNRDVVTPPREGE